MIAHFLPKHLDSPRTVLYSAPPSQTLNVSAEALTPRQTLSQIRASGEKARETAG